jgi:hypothetical protein
MPLKFMLDTNCFDFIFEQQHLQKMVDAKAKGRAEFYFTTVQCDEIEALKDKRPEKYQYVQEVIQKVPVEEAYIYGAYFGLDADIHSKRAYRAPRFGHMTSADHDPLFDQPNSKLTSSHPVGHRGDLNIIITAYHENMDYILTDDNKEPFTNIVKELQVNRGAKLKVIPNNQLSQFL